jgi:hypothetical protein
MIAGRTHHVLCCAAKHESVMTEAPEMPILLEYDLERVFLRVSTATLLAILFALEPLGFSRSTVLCAGGWLQSLGYFAEVECAALFIEVLHWIPWRIAHRNQLLPPEERSALVGRGTREGNLTSPDAGRNYELVVSGGRLLFAPRWSIPASFVFAIAALAILGALSNNLVSPCESATFAWRTFLGLLLMGYTLLAMGSAMGNYVKQKASR